MIDTIKLELQQSMYTIINHDLFTPSTRTMWGLGLWTKGSTMFSKQNPTSKDRKAGVYKPRLSVTRRPLKHLGYQNTLYVEISLPKLLFGNNFDELINDDFEKVKDKLIEVLNLMGVVVRSSQLNRAQISSIHYGKNIVLDDYTTPYSYIKELKKIDISKIKDVNQTDYRNGGMSYKFHSNIFEFTFYDKLKDLEKSKISEKRAIGKDDYCQLSLLDYLESEDQRKNPFEVLRLEMRLNKRRLIRQKLKKEGLEENTTFEYLFDQNLARKLLLSFYNQMLEQYIPTIDSKSPTEAFSRLKTANCELRDGKLLELAMTQIIINQTSIRELRNMINDTTWRRLKKSLRSLENPDQTNYLNKIRSKLSEFEAVKIVDFNNKMLNNVN